MKPRILILPGWQNSGPAHWQSRWEALYGDERVEQADWDRPLRGDWMARLDSVLRDDPLERPAVLVAHSLGCQLVAAWAAHSQLTARVQAALLVAAPDPEQPGWPIEMHNWRVPVRQRLPFPATLVASSDDPFCSLERAGGYAADWGASLVLAGARGHLNGESGLGDWPEGRALLDALIAAR